MQVPWQVRRFVAIMIGLVLWMTYDAWGVPFVMALAALADLGLTNNPEPAPAWSIVTMTLGGLLASIPAAAAYVTWMLGDAAQSTGHDVDAAHAKPLPEDRRNTLMRLREVGWMVVLGMLLGMALATIGLADSWGESLRNLTDVVPDLAEDQTAVTAAMIQAFPFSAAGLFVLSLVASVLPIRFSRSPARDTWVPWRALVWGAVVWLCCAVLAALPTYLRLSGTS